MPGRVQSIWEGIKRIPTKWKCQGKSRLSNMFNQLPCLLLAVAVLPSAIGGPGICTCIVRDVR
jgi:hypothetical protein